MRKTVFLGTTKPEFDGRARRIYLHDFSWDCGWYWAGGYLGNNSCHFHFDGAFLNGIDERGHPLGNFVSPWKNLKKHESGVKVVRNGASVWEDIETFLDGVPKHISENWWRIKDLFKQFYTLRDAAEVFLYGGHCTSDGRTKAEINPKKAAAINKHIETVIIPEIRKIVGFDT